MVAVFTPKADVLVLVLRAAAFDAVRSLDAAALDVAFDFPEVVREAVAFEAVDFAAVPAFVAGFAVRDFKAGDFEVARVGVRVVLPETERAKLFPLMKSGARKWRRRHMVPSNAIHRKEHSLFAMGVATLLAWHTVSSESRLSFKLAIFGPQKSRFPASDAT